MTPEVDLAEPVDPDFDYPTSIQVPIQALEETWYRPAFSEVPTKFSTSLQLATATSLPIEHAPIESESRFSHPISLTFGYEKFFSSKYGTFASTQEESHFNSRRSLLVTGTSRPSLRLRIHEYSSPFSKLIYIRSRTLIKSRDLNRSEQNNLLYENKQTQKILSTPNVISMSYTHEVRNGQRTGRKVLQVGVIKKLKKDEIHHPDICIPKEIELSNDLVVPVQVVAEGKLTLHGKYKGGAQLTLAESEPGTLGARVEANGSCRLWSCAHILTNFKEDAIGSEIYVAHHREYDIDNMEYKYEPSYTSKWRIGGHLKIEKESSQTIVYQDIAWATVSEADLSEEIFGIGPVRIRAMPKVGQTVTIRGGYSGYVRHGTICNTNAPLDDTEKNLKFCKMCYINANLRLKKGDSGSAVVHEFKGTKYLVGIYMGTTDIRTYFSAAVLPGTRYISCFCGTELTFRFPIVMVLFTYCEGHQA